MKLDDFKKLLRDSGVVGAGGAGFPTYAKLSEKADTVILNCAECEPLLRLHRQVLEVYTDEILSALDKILEMTGAKNGIIAVKSHYTETVKALEAEIKDHPKLSVFKLDGVYPSGDEILLIKEVTGRTVQPGELPISVGVTVNNVETVYNVSRALSGKPVTDKFVTVAGEVKNPVTLLVPIGTTVAELVEAAGGATVSDPEYLSGGPMMGKLVSTRDVVTKTTNAIIVLPSNHTVVMNKKRNPKVVLRRAMAACCQCRACTELCSRHLAGYPVEPHMVMRIFSNGGKGDVSTIPGAMFCSGCGLCEAYACPQDLSPRAMIDQIKAAARAVGVKPPKGIQADEVSKDAEYKKVSVARLTSRLGLRKYDVSAPMGGEYKTNKVKILLSQHIGAPAIAKVSEGDMVKKGDVIAVSPDGALGVNIHSSIDGRVSSVTERYVTITKE